MVIHQHRPPQPTPDPEPLPSHYAPEMAKVIERKRLLESRQQTFIRQRPNWQDSFDEMLYMQNSTLPTATPEIASLGRRIIDQDAGAAAARRYGDELDPYYRLPGGGIDTTKVNQDNFVVDVEEMYFGTRGEIPPSWFAEHIDDIKLLGPEFAPVATELYKRQKEIGYRLQAEQANEDVFDARATRMMDMLNVGRQEAGNRVHQIDDIQRQLELEVAQKDNEGQVLSGASILGQEMGGRKSDEEIFDMVKSLLAADPELTRYLTAGNLTKLREDPMAAYAQFRGPQLMSERGLSGDFNELYQGSGYARTGAEGRMHNVESVQQGVMGALPFVATAVSWLIDPSLPAQALYGIKPSNNNLTREQMVAIPFVGGHTSGEANKEQQREYNAMLGVDPAEKAGVMAAGMALDQWNLMVRNDPTEYGLQLRMYGDEETAKAVWVDAFATRDDVQRAFLDQVEKDNSLIRYQIKKIENEDYSSSAMIVDMVSIFGQAITTSTIMTGTGLKYLFDGDVDEIATKQFWQDVRDYETPSAIVGLEGTLLGLGIDFLGTMIMDPTIWGFAGGLSAAGRHGAQNIVDVARMVDNPIAETVIRDTATVIRGGDFGALSAQATLDELALVGLDTRFMAEAQGFINPIRNGSRAYLGTRGVVTDDVHFLQVTNLIDPALVDEAKLTGLIDTIKTVDPTAPVEITINPATGAAQVTDNAELALALQANGIDAIPVTYKIDETFGLIKTTVPAPGNVEISAATQPHTIGNSVAKFDALPKESELWVYHATSAETAEQIKLTGLIPGNKPPDIAGPGIIAPGSPGARATYVSASPHSGVGYGEWAAAGTSNEEAAVVAIRVTKEQLHLPPEAAHLADGPSPLFRALKEPGTGAIIEDVVDPSNIRIISGEDARFAATIRTEEDYARFLNNRLGNMIEEVHPDPGITTAEWARNVNIDDAVSIGEDLHMRPRNVIGDERFGGEVNFENLKAIYEQGMLAGIDGAAGQHTILSVRAGNAIAAAARKMTPESVRALMTPGNIHAAFNFYGAGARAQIMDFGTRLWASVGDLATWELHARKIYSFYSKQAMTEARSLAVQAEREALAIERQGVLNFAGGSLDNVAERLGVEMTPEMAVNHKQIFDMVAELDAKDVTLVKTQNQLANQRYNFSELQTTLRDMENEFNRKYLATHKDFAPFVDPETGLVPSSAITSRSGDFQGSMNRIVKLAEEENISLVDAAKRELGYLPDSVNKRLDIMEGQMDANELLQASLHILDSPGSYVASMTPLEMMAAAAGGKRAVGQIIKGGTAEAIMEGAHKAHMLWMLDKVMTPHTAMTVSLDEWMRIFHMGGGKTVFQFLEDKAMGTAAKITRAKKTAGGWDALPKRWQDRLVALEEMPLMFRQMERSWTELSGYGYDVLRFDPKLGRANKAYFKAARRTTGQLTGDKVFQQFIKGRESFLEWYGTSTEGAALRQVEFYDASISARRTGLTAEEAYQSYQTIFEDWALGGIKAGKKAQARQLWKEATERAAANESTAAGVAELPQWVLEGYGEITGNKSVQGMGRTVTNAVSDTLFGDPINFRRGFLAELVRKSEMARLKKLYASQGRRIVSNEEMRLAIKQRYPALLDSTINSQLDTLAADLFSKQGIISQTMVDTLVESKVISEMENALYSFQTSSRAARSTSAAVPFGKPWADMWGYWGRQMLARPQLRGWINDTNFLNMGNIANKLVDKLPFNPRTTAFISRIANTDLNLDRIEEDPVVGWAARAVGMDRMDLSGGVFLPTGGQDPWRSFFPGLGLIPTAAAMGLFNRMTPDPIEDPQGYNQAVQQWSQFVPSIGYQHQGEGIGMLPALAAGGGVTSRFWTAAQQADAALGREDSASDALTHNWRARTAADKQIKVMFQEKDLLAELADLPPELINEGISAFLDEYLKDAQLEATQTAALQGLGESALEFGLPVSVTLFTQNDDLTDVWIDAVDTLGLTVPSYYNTNTEDNKAEMASWIKSQFFAKPDWERDALVAAPENAGLAVNLVSMWEWSERAKTLGIPGTALPYRTEGSTEGLARHSAYQNRGLVQPVTPRNLALNIVGTILRARANTAQNLYEDAATQVNDFRWDLVVSDKTKAGLDVAASIFNRNDMLPYQTGRELWQNYGDLKEQMDLLDPPTGDDTGFSILTDQRAWGQTYPSDKEGIRDDLAPLPLIRVTPEMQQMADAVGIDISPTMTMQELYQDVANRVSDNYLENPVFAYIGPEYTAYLEPRSSGMTSTSTTMNRILNGAQFEGETQNLYRSSLSYIDEAMRRKRRGDPSWREVRDKAADKWNRMAQDDGFMDIDTNKLWNDAWGKTLGSPDWVPDEPLPIDAATANRVYVHRVVDGDTIDVTDGGARFGAQSYYRVRLLGYNQAELGTDEGEAAKQDLNARIAEAVRNGVPVTVVRDPDRYGNTDLYGRVFGWLYIGDEPVYDPDTMLPRRTD
jgi:hypothetical protein